MLRTVTLLTSVAAADLEHWSMHMVTAVVAARWGVAIVAGVAHPRDWPLRCCACVALPIDGTCVGRYVCVAFAASALHALSCGIVAISWRDVWFLLAACWLRRPRSHVWASRRCLPLTTAAPQRTHWMPHLPNDGGIHPSNIEQELLQVCPCFRLSSL